MKKVVGSLIVVLVVLSFISVFVIRNDHNSAFDFALDLSVATSEFGDHLTDLTNTMSESIGNILPITTFLMDKGMPSVGALAFSTLLGGLDIIVYPMIFMWAVISFIAPFLVYLLKFIAQLIAIAYGYVI